MSNPIDTITEPVIETPEEAAPVAQAPQVTHEQLHEVLERLSKATGGSPMQRHYLLESLTAMAEVAEDFDLPISSDRAIEAAYRLVQFNMENLRLCGQPMAIGLVSVQEVAPSPIIIPGTMPQNTIRLDVQVSSPCTAVLGYLHQQQKEGKVLDSDQLRASTREAIIFANGMTQAANSIRATAVEVQDYRAPLPAPIVG